MIYRFELKRVIVKAAVWSGVISLVLLLLVYGFYPIFLESRDAMEPFIKSFPPEIAAGFGFDMNNMFSYNGFSGIVYLYVALLSGIAASIVALSVFAREKQSKCSDFLFTKPCARNVFFVKKLLVCISAVAVIAVPYMILNIVSYIHYEGSGSISKAILSTLCIPLTMLVFIAIGVFLGVYLKKVRSSSGLGTGIGLFAFLLSALSSITENKALRFISPIYYFNPEDIVNNGSYDVPCAVFAAALCIALFILSYVKYTKTDIAAQ